MEHGVAMIAIRRVHCYPESQSWAVSELESTGFSGSWNANRIVSESWSLFKIVSWSWRRDSP